MQTLQDLETKATALRLEMAALLRRLADAREQNANETELIELSEQYAILALQAAQFEKNIDNFRAFATMLADAPASGPH